MILFRNIGHQQMEGTGAIHFGNSKECDILYIKITFFQCFMANQNKGGQIINAMDKMKYLQGTYNNEHLVKHL